MSGGNFGDRNRIAEIYSSYLHGAKGSAIVSKSGDIGMPSSTFKSQSIQGADLIWESKVKAGEEDPYQNEWNT